MINPKDTVVLGIDGGGTKTVARITTFRDNVPVASADGIAGSANATVIPFEAAARHVADAIAAACQCLDAASPAPQAACLSLAGAANPALKEQWHRWAVRQNLARHICVTTDPMAAHAAAFGSDAGIVVISGTGSIAWGRNSAGQTVRVGGWGPFFGDEGSGYAVAIAALRSAARSADGRDLPTALLPSLLRFFRIGPHDTGSLQSADSDAIINQLATAVARSTREQIARAAEIVVDHCQRDAVATQIIDAAAAELAQLVRIAAKRLAMQPGHDKVAVAGGLLLNCPHLRQALARQLAVNATDLVLVREPVDGAIRLARLLID